MTSIAAGEVLVAPSDLLAVLKPALYGVTLGDCARALASVFPGTGLHVVISGHAKIAGDAVAAIETAYEESRVVAVLTRAAERSRAWAYTDFGPPGAVTKREYVEDLDIIQLTYANGVRVNLKQTDFDPGRIMVSARVGSGSITEPPDQRGLAQIAGSVFNGGALGRHSRDDLRRILAGRNAGVALQVMTDALVFAYPTFSNVRGPSGTGATGTTREDLLLTLQLFAAHLSDPGYRPEGFRQNQQTLGLIYGSINQVHGPLAMEVSNLIAGGDSRFGLPPREVIMARTIDEVRAWLSPQLAHGAIEVAIVGDFDVDATIDAVAQTLGALPTREPPLALADLRTVSFPASPFTKSYAVSSQIPQGLVLLYWPTSDGIDAQFDQRLSLLARVYGDRLRAKLRDEGGGPEGPRVQSVTSETYPGYGYLFASVDVEFSAADKIAEAAIAIAHDLATTGVTEEDLDCVRLSMLSTAVQALGDNAHWLGRVLARAQEKPAVLDWERMRIRDLENITVEEVNTLAQRYLGRDQVSRVTIMPAE
jgi:zinc protease